MTQYVYLHYIASFECAINVTGYNISFVYGSNITADQVTVTNLTNRSRKIEIYATTEVNGSYIYCVAHSELLTTASSTAYIYIQGIIIFTIKQYCNIGNFRSS